MTKINISDIMNGAWKERAIYTAEERGIPSFADGLKPVQRYLVCKALKTAKNKFEKVATISTIATEGYHHGEASAAAALIGLAADFSNNLPIFEGDGNFGNVLNPSAGAPRYIYARLSPLFEKLYKDTDIAPIHSDPDHIPPVYYLPIIPMVLVNGIKGIATGYATDIPPHDVISIVNWLIARAKGKAPNKIIPKYYDFSGDIEVFEDHYLIKGKYNKIGSTKIHITELPRGYTSASYETVLNKLEEKGMISSYDNNSHMNKFDYTVVLKKGNKWTDDQIKKYLKLETTHTWNLTTVSPKGKIQEWNKRTGIDDIMEAFYTFRLPFIAKRIENKINEYEFSEQYLKALIGFCNDIIISRFTFKGMNDESFRDILISKYKAPESSVNKIMNMPVRVFTTEMMEKLKDDLLDVQKELKYFKDTTPEIEYIKDLNEFEHAFKKEEKEKNM